MNKGEILKVDLRSNNLLKSLQSADQELLLPHLNEIEVKPGKVLYEPGDDVKVTYFPCNDALVSFMVLLDGGQTVETALIGREGAVGGIISQGHLPAYCQSVVQFGGRLLCIETLRIEEAKMSSVFLRHWFARYSDCLLSQVFQSVACNATHSVEQRTAKWICAAIERTGDHIIPLSQEQLAGMLGVGRSYVARVIGNFKANGLIETYRGKLRIHSIDALKAFSCGCNEQVKHHYETVLGGIYPAETDKN